MRHIHKIPADIVGESARHAAILVHDSIAQKFTPHFGGDLEAHTIGKIGEHLFRDEVRKAGIHIKSDPIRESYTKLSEDDDFVLHVAHEDIKVEVKTANVFKKLNRLPSGFKFFLNAAQEPFDWDFVVSIFVNLTDLTYQIMGCVEREHVGVYPIAGSRGARHYEIPIEFLLPVECVWSDCEWKDQ